MNARNDERPSPLGDSFNLLTEARAMFRAQKRRKISRSVAVEGLESRIVLDASIAAMGNTLLVRGNSLADQVTVTDAGNGLMMVSHSGLQEGRTQAFRGIEKVHIELGDGNDSIRYRMLDPASGATGIHVDLGAGRFNSFSFDAASSQTNADRPVFIDVTGEGGNDSVRVTADSWAGKLNLHASLGAGDDEFVSAVSTNSPLIDPGSLVGFNPQPDPPAIQFDVVTGTGDDIVNLQLQAAWGDHRLNVSLGEGNDVTIGSIHATEEPSQGEIIPCVRVAIAGDGGNDAVQMDLSQYTGEWDATMRLGGGNDRLMMTALNAVDENNLVVHGDSGNDLIDLLFSCQGRTSGSGPHVELFGDEGDDRIRLDIIGIGDPDWLDLFLDGGTGTDLILAPSAAHIVNAE